MNQSFDVEERKQEKDGRTGTRHFSWWRLAFALAGGLVLGIGLLFFLQLMARPLALLVIAVAIATSMAPLVNYLQFRYSFPRSLASMLVFLGFILIFVGLGMVIVPGLIFQGRAFIERLPNFIDLITAWLARSNVIDPTAVMDTLPSQLGSLSTQLVTLPIRIFSSFFDILLILFIALYWLILMPSMQAFFLSLFSESRQAFIREILHKMGQAMGGYVRGTLINGVIVGLLTYIGLLVIGVEYALVLGILAGTLEVIPVLGPILAGVVIVATALLDSPSKALIAGIYLLVMQQLESNILVPNVMRKQTNTSPLLVLMAVYLGGTIGGLAWALAAIPLVAVLRVIITDLVAPAIREYSGADPVSPP